MNNSSCYELSMQKSVSEDDFADFMSMALPLLMFSIMRKDKSAVSKGDISIPQYWALHYINEEKEISVNELAGKLNRCKSSTSGLLNRLSNSGLIDRNPCKQDGRKVLISLSTRGKKLIHDVEAYRKAGIRTTYATLSNSERASHKTMLEKVLSGIQTSTLTLVALFFLSFSVMAAEEPRSYSLKDSIQIGLKRSLVIANASREQEIARATQKRAVADAYPQLAGTAGYVRNFPDEINGYDNFSGKETSDFGAEATWQIFAGGRTLSAIRAAKEYRKLTNFQKQRIREMEARDISLAYYQVQLAQAQLDVRELSFRQLADFEADARQKYDAGTASEFDWLSAKVALSNEEPQLISARNRLSLAFEKFRNLTYISDEEIQLSDPLAYAPVQVNLHEAIALSLQKQPGLLEKSSSVLLRKEDINQKRSEYYPKVDLHAGYTYQNPDPYSFMTQEDGWQDYWNAGIRANWKLFDGGSRRASLSESKLKMAIEEDEYSNLIRTVSLEVRTQWIRGRDAALVIDATTESIGLAERALKIARTRFDAGLSTNLEVTQANLELSDARLARYTALYEHMVAVTGMKYAIGILLEDYDNE